MHAPTPSFGEVPAEVPARPYARAGRHSFVPRLYNFIPYKALTFINSPADFC